MKTKKFRVWCKNKNQWETHDTYLSSEGQLLHFDGHRLLPLMPENHIVEWCIGLDDKNGKEIYEGDIVRSDWYNGSGTHKSYTQAVRYYQDTCVFATGYATKSWKGQHEVIGNIHDNPEIVTS